MTEKPAKMSRAPADRRNGAPPALDARDALLLNALEQNARASVVDLARKLGLSRSATQERLGRLERSGAIAAYTIRRGASVQRERLNALLMIRHKDGKSCADVVPELKAHPAITSIVALSGEVDLIVRAEVADAAELGQLADTIRARPQVASVTTHVVLDVVR